MNSIKQIFEQSPVNNGGYSEDPYGHVIAWPKETWLSNRRNLLFNKSLHEKNKCSCKENRVCQYLE